MKNRIFEKQKVKGIALPLILIGIAGASFIAVNSFVSTSSSLKVSGNYAKSVEAFNIAEVGVAKARTVVEGAGSFSSLMATYGNNPIITTTSFNGGNYIAYVLDNDDGDGNPAADVDNTIVVKAIGTSASGSRVQIESSIKRMNTTLTIPVDAPTAANSATLFCGTEQIVTLGGSSQIDGRNYNYTTGAVVSGGGPALAAEGGMTYNSSASTTGDAKLLVPASTSKIVRNLSTSANCNQWDTFANQLASLSASAPGVIIVGNGTHVNQTWGTAASPKIVIFHTDDADDCVCYDGSDDKHSGSDGGDSGGSGHDSGCGLNGEHGSGSGVGSCHAGSSGDLMSDGDIKLAGNISIFGIAVIASDVRLKTDGNLGIKGLVLLDSAHAELELKGSGSAAATIYGRVISTAHDKDISVEGGGHDSGHGSSGATLAASDTISGSGNAKIRYSSSALGIATGTLTTASSSGGAAHINVAWKETY